MRLYIAYGSNLNLEQMKYRCPDATIYGKGQILNYRLRFKGSLTGSYATIDRAKGETVPVVVWKISERDERNLDRYEGYPTFYHKHNLIVQMDDEKRLKAMVYIMRPHSEIGVPSLTYIKTVSDGYTDNGLDLNVLEKAIGINLIECSRKQVY